MKAELEMTGKWRRTSAGGEGALGEKEGTRSQPRGGFQQGLRLLLSPPQVLHSQSRHVEVRMACIHYLRENREKFEEVTDNFKRVTVP